MRGRRVRAVRPVRLPFLESEGREPATPHRSARPPYAGVDGDRWRGRHCGGADARWPALHPDPREGNDARARAPAAEDTRRLAGAHRSDGRDPRPAGLRAMKRGTLFAIVSLSGASVLVLEILGTR